MYKLIVRRVPARPADTVDAITEDRIITRRRIEAKQFRAKWNFNAKQHDHPKMEHEEVDGEYILYVMLPSEQEAVIFKLTEL